MAGLDLVDNKVFDQVEFSLQDSGCGVEFGFLVGLGKVVVGLAYLGLG